MEIILALIFITGSLLILRKNRGLTAPIAIIYILTVIYLTFLIREPTPLYRYSLKPFNAAIRAIEFGGGLLPGLLSGTVKITSWKSLESVVLNIMLFVPFGYLVPLLWKKTDRWWKVVLLGFCVSLLIEAIQLLTRLGFADVDDLINNTIGSVVGYLFYKLLLTHVVNKES